MKPFSLTICMIVRDEEEYLASCLRSVQGIAAEIVVADTGSADRSIEIAESFGAKVISVPWENDFSKARNAALDEANGEWILVLDADEVIDVPDLSVLEKLLARDDVLGYYLKLSSYIGNGAEYVTDSVCRLFRNHPRIRFTGVIHEQVVSHITSLCESALEFSDIEIRHHGYTDSVIQKKNKNERNMRMIKEALAHRKDDLQLLYALATEYFQQQDYSKALSIFRSILPRVPVYSGYASDILIKTACSFKETGDRQSALRLVEEGLSFYPDFTDLLEYKAMLLVDDQRFEEALTLLKRAIKTSDSSQKYTTASGSGTYRSLYMSGMVYEKLYLWQEACDCYGRALDYHQGYSPAWYRWTLLCYMTGRIEAVATFVQKHFLAMPVEVKRYLMQLSIDLWCPELADLLAGSGWALEPVQMAIFSSQKGMEHDSMEKCQQCLLSPGSEAEKTKALLCLWAQALKTEDSRTARKYMEDLEQADRGFSSLNKRFYRNGTNPVPESAFRAAQSWLLRLGAWKGFIDLTRNVQNCPPLGGLPASLKCMLLNAPLNVKAELFLLLWQRERPLPLYDLLIAGIFAVELKEYKQAFRLFEEMSLQTAQQAKLYADLGMIQAAAGLAGTYCTVALEPLRSELKFMILGTT